jgi:hypothetical protein
LASTGVAPISIGFGQTGCKKIGLDADGDPKARKQLDALNAEFTTLAGEIESIKGAIAEAQLEAPYAPDFNG